MFTYFLNFFFSIPTTLGASETKNKAIIKRFKAKLIFPPRAFLVNRYEVAEPLTILLKMKNAEFNPRDVVFLEDSLDVKVDPPGENASAEITEYQIQKIKLKVKATGNNLLFLSEVWYPRWKCFIDGKEVPIYRANYVFRAVVVPPGEHEVLFIYKDEKFELGG